MELLTVTLSVISLGYGIAKLRTEWLNGSKVKLENQKLEKDLESGKKQKKLKK